ncbi:acetyl-CoA synthetase-like protein [Laetiporus sulphureus 93-53]|uniref:Acetyl-CoA synthetase-like protein n=1 Tax=Laetiporus sulphureus 93-53 TaxID=1314785 RepID=A0A165CVG7_9APHY|nr:acetyl-CoA synthetase-like protein [Laetiporus sulphureus 93-53]KZT03502.1 acetyl-CoA synthetase-like protein [Laetiporus sulphureus 93-53]
MALSDYIVTDDLTIILGLVAACLFLLHNLYKPQSLVHPILLGRQSDAARVRHPGESAIYRNYGTGMMGKFPVRPSKEQLVLLDLVKADSDAPRTLWSTRITNPELRDRVAAFGTGLINSTKLIPQESNVLLLLNDGIEFLIADLALASYAIPSFVLTSASLLSSVLESHPPSVIITDTSLLSALLELLYDSNDSARPTIVVVGAINNKEIPGSEQARLLRWEDIERSGAKSEKLPFASPNPRDVFTVSFFSSPSGELAGTQLTHENLTAGVAAVCNLLPMSTAMTPLDTVVSAFPMSTPYGRAVAYTAINEGTSFATLNSSKVFTENGDIPVADLADVLSVNTLPIPSPTVLFIKPQHLTSMTAAILGEARKSSLLYSVAWRHKNASLSEGYITKQSLWDRLMFDTARAKVLGKGAGTIRATIVSGGIFEGQSLVPARIALSVPVVHVHTHPLVAGPVFASHPLDLQTFPQEPASVSASASDAYAFAYLASVGPPAVNMEVKMMGVDDNAIENGADPCGLLYVRGPSVGRLLGSNDDASEDADQWVQTGQRAKVAANGTFKVAVQDSKSK